jgi:putative membrane protein
MWGHMGDYGWGGMGIGMLLLWGILIAAIVLLIKYTWGAGTFAGRDRREKNALELLKERYARGEIGREEFEQKKSDIES